MDPSVSPDIFRSNTVTSIVIQHMPKNSLAIFILQEPTAAVILIINKPNRSDPNPLGYTRHLRRLLFETLVLFPIDVRLSAWLVLSRMARAVAALRGRANAGLQSRRRRSMLMRTVGFGLSEVLEVVFGLVCVFVFVDDVVVSLVVVGGLEELDFVVVDMRLAGVKINHLIKRKSIGAFCGAIVGMGEPVRKELKIRWRGCRRLE